MTDRTERRGPPNVDGMTTLKVDNISFRSTPESLKEIFSPFGEIGDVYIPRNFQSMEPRGFAFIRFMEKKDAEDALRALDNTEHDGRVLAIQEAKERRPDQSRGGGGMGSRYGDRGGGGYRDDRGRDRGNDRDRDGYRGGDRGGDRYGGGGYDRGGDRGYDRDRGDRDRGYDRGGDRDRGYDRGGDRDRGYDRDGDRDRGHRDSGRDRSRSRSPARSSRY